MAISIIKGQKTTRNLSNRIYFIYTDIFPCEIGKSLLLFKKHGHSGNECPSFFV